MTDNLGFITVPNVLTLARIVMAPIVAWLISTRTDIAAVAIFCVASITDFLDGYLARRLNCATLLGKFMDPLADKFLVVSCMVMLAMDSQKSPWLIMAHMYRDTVVTAIRELASMQLAAVVESSSVGKLKTAVLMVALPCIMLHRVWNWAHPLGSALLYVSTALSYVSMVQYTRTFFKMVIERHQTKSITVPV